MGKWETVRLGDVCEIVSGSTPKTSVPEYWNGDIKWITPAEMNEQDYYIADTARHISEYAGLKPMPIGTVLLSSRAPIGKVAITAAEMCCNQGFKNLICSEHISNRYLYWYLKDKTEYLNSLGRGATFKEISKSIVENIEIPFPPLEIQNRLADILEANQSIVSNRKLQIEKLDLLIKSQFNQVFGDLKTNPHKWSIVPLSDTVIIDTVMTTDFMKYQNYQHVGIENIEKDTGKIINTELVRNLDLKSGKYLFSSNHIIYSKIRPNLNKVALPDFEGLCSADAYPILPKNEYANRYYITYVLRSEFFLGYILRQSDRTNIPKANKKQLLGFSLPLPPVELQNQFSDFVKQVEHQKALLQLSLAKMEENYRSLIQKCFRGEIFS